jgi:hypothetical protein
VQKPVNIITQHDLLDLLLQHYQADIGKDFTAYRHHCFRVLNLAFWHSDHSEQSLEKIALACAFHDLAIWVCHNFDYIDPSVALAQHYLQQQGLSDWSADISLLISEHHKVTACDDNKLAEAFRKADWTDVSLGLLNFGLDRALLRALYQTFPTAGFHWRLVQLSAAHFVKHPLKPLPMFKW